MKSAVDGLKVIKEPFVYAVDVECNQSKASKVAKLFNVCCGSV